MLTLRVVRGSLLALSLALFAPAALVTFSGCGGDEAVVSDEQAPMDLRQNLEASQQASGEAATAPAKTP